MSNNIISLYKTKISSYENKCNKICSERLTRHLIRKINKKFKYIMARGRWKRCEKMKEILLKKTYKTPRKFSQDLRRWHNIDIEFIVQKVYNNLTIHYNIKGFYLSYEFYPRKGLIIHCKINPYQ